MSGQTLRDRLEARASEDGDADHPWEGGDVAARLETASRLGRESTPELAYDLMEEVTEALGQPCDPFVPGIRIEASGAIERLEKGDRPEGNDARVLVDLVGRLMGVYALGGDVLHPVMGWRLYPATELNLAAAGRICLLAPEVDVLVGLGMLPSPAAGLTSGPVR